MTAKGMRNFHRIATGIPVAPLMHALIRHSELWNANNFRTTFPSTPHVDVDDIMLRFSDTEKCTTTTHVIGDDKPVWHEASKLLPEAKPIVMALMQTVSAYELGRLLITRISPGGKILRHSDARGEYVNMGDIARYHVVIKGFPGSLFHCGDETVNMQTGEVWWFNAHMDHAVENNSVEDRIHMLVDVRTWA